VFEQALAWNAASPDARQNHARARLGAVRQNDAAGADEWERQTETDIILSTASESARNPSISRSPPPITFVDRHHEAGLDFHYFTAAAGMEYLREQRGGGVAVLDYDGDGWPDLYFPQSCRLPIDADDSTYIDRLYRNLGNGAYGDATAGSGLRDNQY